MQPTNLKYDGRTNPIDLDHTTPHFGWLLAADAPGERQTAYRIRVASTAESLANDQADLWDSGRIESADTFGIAYAGTPLTARQAAVWTVSVWDQDGSETAASESAAFAVALLSSADWHATWIGHAGEELPLLRRTFAVRPGLRRAMIYICGLGQFDLRCNGRRVGEDFLQPGWTDYRKTCQYVAHDLTPLLATGDNALGVMLGHGMYHVGDAPAGTKRYTKFKGSFGPPKLIAQLHLDYIDGTSAIIATDEQWLTSPGPITYSNIYGGEDYDARLAQPGWDTAAFDATRWRSAVRLEGPGGVLRGSSHAAPPVRITRRLDASFMAAPAPHNMVFDTGQNCSMVPRVVFRGPAGSRVKISPAESLNDDGTVNQKHTGSPTSYSYTLRGNGDEAWSPAFSYTGGRYLQIETQPGDNGLHPLPLVIQSLHLTAATDSVGTFECSNPLFTRTAELIDWAIRSNTVSTLTDCPHREKLGWTEEQYLMGPSLMYAYDFRTLYGKIAADHTDAQRPTGDVPTICPQFTQFQPPWDVFNDSPEWGSAAILVPWQCYRWYGDRALLHSQYPTMRRYFDYLTGRADNGILDHGLGDWYDLGPNPPGFSQLTPKALTGTATYYLDAVVLSKTARVLGRETDAQDYAAFASQLKAAFIRKFYDFDARTFATASQTSLAMPLVLGLVPERDRPAVLANLIADIRSRDNGLTSGDVGYRYLLTALADAGRSDVIFDMNSRSDRPGYGMMIAKDQTALTEAWDARPESSRNHFMLGHIQEWLYARLAGIAQADDSVAFDKIVIQPTPVGDVTHAKANYESARGRIAVEWNITGDTFALACTIPPNTTGVVYLPTGKPDGEPISHVIAPGTHQFATTLQ